MLRIDGFRFLLKIQKFSDLLQIDYHVVSKDIVLLRYLQDGKILKIHFE